MHRSHLQPTGFARGLRRMTCWGALGLSLLAGACGGDSSSPVGGDDLTAVVLTPPEVQFDALGDTMRLLASGSPGGGSLEAEWSSLDEVRVRVEGEGLVTALTPGTGRVVARYRGLADTAAVEVRQLATALAIAQASDTLDAIGDVLALDVSGHDRNGFELDPSQLTWRSLDPAIADVSTDGEITGEAVGTAEIEVTNASGLADRVTIVVRQVPTHVTLLPVDTLRVLGDTVRLSILAEDANGHPIPAPEPVWTSLDPQIVGVGEGGVARALREGVGRIVASMGAAVSDTVAVRVLVSQDLFLAPTSIDSTGNTDVTGALNAFFRSVPNGALIRLREGGRYRVEGVLLFVDRRGLTLDGNGATILADTDGRGTTPPSGLAHLWPRQRKHVLFRGGSDIQVRNLTIRGPHRNGGTSEDAYVSALEAQHGLEFAGVDGVTVRNVQIREVYGDFVYLGAYEDRWTRNVMISDSRFEKNGRQGLAISAAEDVVFERNNVSQVRRSHIDLEPFSARGGARRVTIRNNVFGTARLTFVASLGHGSNVEDVTVADNELRGKTMNVIVEAREGERKARFRILRNRTDATFGSPVPAMRFTRVDGIEVRENYLPLSADRNMIGVRSVESCDVIVADNDFPGSVADADIEPWAGCTSP